MYSIKNSADGASVRELNQNQSERVYNPKWSEKLFIFLNFFFFIPCNGD